MFFSNVAKRGGKLLVRLINDDGSHENFETEYSPITFLPTNKEPTKDDWTTLYGDAVKQVEHGSIRDMEEYVKNYSDISNFRMFGHDFPLQHQYLNRMFPGAVVADRSKMNIYAIDIETTAKHDFPNSTNPVEEILLISMMNLFTGKVDIFTRKSFTLNPEWVSIPENKLQIHVWESEKALLERFVSFWKSSNIDIITGWNSEFFDIPYLCARIISVCGKPTANQLSPFNSLQGNTKFNKITNKDEPVVKIVGISHLDYLALYGKFTLIKREAYTLDHISEVELNAKKLDHSEFVTFEEFYTNGWDKFCCYNIVDVLLVNRLDKKLGIIDLAILLATTAKINYDEVYSPVATWDAIIHNFLWASKRCVPNKTRSEKSEQYEGAFVKPPVIGVHKSVASFDAASLYPSIMQGLNISPETLYTYDSTLDKPVEAWLAGEVHIPEEYANYAVSCNGAVFSRNKLGVVGELIDHFMTLRKVTKKEMLAKKQEKEKYKEGSPEYIKLEAEISYLSTKEKAIKVLNNSLYGAFGNVHMRYFDIRLARAITTMGQYIIQKVADSVNKFGYKCKATSDIVIYMDTDSTYISLHEVMSNNIAGFSDLPVLKQIDLLDKFCSGPVQKAITTSTDTIHEFFNFYKKTIEFKREAISDRGIFLAKKRYLLSVYDMEGVRYNEPDLKIMGLEIVKSSTPQIVRDKLKECIPIILNGDEDGVRDAVMSFKCEFESLEPHKIAFPRSANNLEEYVGTPIYRKGTPSHIRAALVHNHLIKKKKLHGRYRELVSGQKIKFVYLLSNNPIRESAIGFFPELPREFGIEKYIDRDTMFQKTFLDPLNSICKPLNWNISQHASFA